MTAPTTILSVDDARAALPVDDADDSVDDGLTALVEAMTAVVEDYKREAIIQRTVVEWPTLTGRREFTLGTVPVLELTSLVSADGSTTWDLSTLAVDSLTGVVHVTTGDLPCGRFTLTYTAGYDTIPPRYREGAKIVLKQLWDAYRGVGTVEPAVTGPEEIRNYDPTANDLLPRRARELLGPPRAARP